MHCLTHESQSDRRAHVASAFTFWTLQCIISLSYIVASYDSYVNPPPPVVFFRTHLRRAQAHGDTCLICRNGLYLHNGACVADCPSHLTSSGTAQWRRRCLEPFECKMHSGKASNKGRLVGLNVGYGCACPTKNCAYCSFNAGESGSHCLQCRNKEFLFNGTCHSTCDAVIQSSDGQFCLIRCNFKHNMRAFHHVRRSNDGVYHAQSTKQTSSKAQAINCPCFF